MTPSFPPRRPSDSRRRRPHEPAGKRRRLQGLPCRGLCRGPLPGGMTVLRNFDVIVLGAGAAGLMAAIEAGRRGRRVLLLEKYARPAEKIRISGGGRCNFTNLTCPPATFLSRTEKR